MEIKLPEDKQHKFSTNFLRGHINSPLRLPSSCTIIALAGHIDNTTNFSLYGKARNLSPGATLYPTHYNWLSYHGALHVQL